ncbi:hypothetical protein Leryth_008144 [Lithospermum erythrorhizon]|nr:hypothetical protein Leryth_008144 [Lithospermum erythrorhizon]
MDFLSSNMNSTAMMDSCSSAVTQVANIAIHMVGFMVIVFFCNCLHLLLRRASQSLRVMILSLASIAIEQIYQAAKSIPTDLFSDDATI